MKVETSDGKIYDLDEKVVQTVILFRNISEDLDDNDNITPLENVNSETFLHIIEYCNLENVDFKTFDLASLDTMEKFEGNEIRWIKNIDTKSLIDLINAANFLEVSRLIHLCACRLAQIIRDKPQKEIMEIFGLSDEVFNDNFGESYWNERYRTVGI